MSRKSDEARIEQRRKQVAVNLLAGFTYRQMAEALDVSVGTIASDVKVIIERWREETVKDAREYISLELQRIDRALNAIWKHITKGEVTYIDRMIKLMDRRAKYLGLDAPDKIAPTDPSGEKEYGSERLTEEQRLERLVALLERGRARRDSEADRGADGG